MTDKLMAALAAVAAALALWFGLAAGREGRRADAAERQAVQLRRDAETAQALADLRADAARQALDVANAAAAANHRQASAYLQLPTPAPADRCAAAQALVDQALAEERP